MRQLFQPYRYFLLALLCGLADASAEVRLYSDLAYGSHPRQVLDVYAAASKSAPVIVMVHGGAWQHGDKRQSAVVQSKVQRWRPRGFLLVALNYRLLPEADPGQQAEDVAAAVAFVRRNAGQWGGDPRRLILMGHSAGAHLIALLAAAPAQFGFGPDAWLGSVVLDSAALDVAAIMDRRHPRFYDKAFGPSRGFWHQVSPLQQLEPNAAPIMLVCSSVRRDRPCERAGQFADAARARGRRAEVLAQPLSHAQINRLLGEESAYTRAVEAFMASLDPEVARRLGAVR